MAAINDLIRQIADPDLRDRIQKEVDKLANIELGTLIESQKTAKQVEDLFTRLVFNKVFVEV